MSSPSAVSMDRAASSDSELLTPDASGPAPSNGAHAAGENGAASNATSGDEDSSLVTEPATRRKTTRAKKSGSSASTVSRPKRSTRKKIEPPQSTISTLPPAPLTRPDGTPAPVVHLAGELSPYARTGGLGEAVASLAKYQAASGIPVTVFMPLYAAVRERTEVRPLGAEFAVSVGPRTETARLFEPATPHQPGTPRIVFVESEQYFDRPGLYGDDLGDYPDNARRYAFFARAILVALPRVLTQPPSIVHAHDWQTALASIYLKTEFAAHPYYEGIRAVLSVHNAGYQGHFPESTMADIGLPLSLYNHRQLEWWGRVNLLKGGLVFSDLVVTVSPTHAHELRTEKGGFGLDGVFVGAARPARRHRQRDRSGHLGSGARHDHSAPVFVGEPGGQEAQPSRPAARDGTEPVAGADLRAHGAPRLAEGARPHPRRSGLLRLRRAVRLPRPRRGALRADAHRARRARAEPHRGEARLHGGVRAPAARRRRHVPDAVAVRAMRPHADARAALRHHSRSRDASADWPTRSRTASPASCSTTTRRPTSCAPRRAPWTSTTTRWRGRR